jgi:hypothetical protein
MHGDELAAPGTYFYGRGGPFLHIISFINLIQHIDQAHEPTSEHLDMVRGFDLLFLASVGWVVTSLMI